MKKSFTKEYILENKGCYSRDQVLALPFGKTGKITIAGLFKALPIKDFSWFLVRKCELTLTEKRLFALHCAKQVLPIFENKCPNDSRVRDCIDATERCLNGNETLENLKVFIDVAADAAYYAAAYAADVGAADGYAAAYAAYYVAVVVVPSAAAGDAYVADVGAAAGYAADAAAAAYADDAYRVSILNFVKSL